MVAKKPVKKASAPKVSVLVWSVTRWLHVIAYWSLTHVDVGRCCCVERRVCIGWSVRPAAFRCRPCALLSHSHSRRRVCDGVIDQPHGLFLAFKQSRATHPSCEGMSEEPHQPTNQPTNQQSTHYTSRSRRPRPRRRRRPSPSPSPRRAPSPRLRRPRP